MVFPKKRDIQEYRLSISRLAIFALAMMLVAGAARAADTSRIDFSDSFEIGLEGESYQYREPELDNLIGEGFGLNGTYTANFGKWFLKANVIADFFNLDYSSNGTGSKSGTTDYLQDYRALFGRDFTVSHGTTLSPYLGVGFRVLFDSDKATTSVGAVGYDRRSEYLYVPLGASFSFHAGKWGLKPSAEYDYFLQGWQTSYTSDDGFDNNLHNTQTAGWGGRAEFMITPPVDFYHFSFGPYLRYWSIHDSNVQTLYLGGVAVATGVEPSNNTTEIGLRANIKF
jgi:hypothetical protein